MRSNYFKSDVESAVGNICQKELMVAILQRAIRDLEDKELNHLITSVGWIFCEDPEIIDPDAVFSFQNVVETLNLDLKEMRKRLKIILEPYLQKRELTFEHILSLYKDTLDYFLETELHTRGIVHDNYYP